MWIYLLVSLTIAKTSFAELTGEHICQEEERYLVNVTQYVLKKITVRKYDWCFQYPPRCSVITYKTLNQSEIVEEEKVRYVNVCCKQYRLDSLKEKCVPECVCVNGVCNNEHKCYCNPGYRGDYCEKECDGSRWGRYCRYHCNCVRGECNSITGKCICPSGWIGPRCELQCPNGFFGADCVQQCNCLENKFCDHVDGRCLDTSTTQAPPMLKKYHTFNENVTKRLDLYLLTTTTPNTVNLSTISYVQTTTEYLNNILSTQLYVEEEAKILNEDIIKSQQEQDDVNIKSTDQYIMKADDSKGKVLSEVSGTWITSLPEETWTNNEASLENPSATLAISCILIIGVLIVIFLVAKLLKSGALHKAKHTHATCATSIFHSPLPELPQTTETISIEPVCENKEIPRAYLELFYDHPPSTGSYRATISPVPAEIKSTSEPLYAEIPFWKQDELYVNTSIEDKTSF